MVKFLLKTWILLLLPIAVLADPPAQGIGDVAESLVHPVSILSDFIGTASIILGIAAIFAALLKYNQYKINPLASPLSSVIVLLFLGIILLCLPFTYLLTGGVPYFGR